MARARWLTGAAAGLAAFTPGARLAAVPRLHISEHSLRRMAPLDRYVGGYESVLGSSLDLIIEAARPADAAECERRLLDEIERLRRILSTYDSTSEISRVMAGEPLASAELAELFATYETWTTRSAGLISLHLGGVIAEWREAMRTGRTPERTILAQAARRSRAFNVDALGKAFIVDRAVAVARRIAPGGLLNLGGDIRAWGDNEWLVGVADPRNPADNARPLARFTLCNAAVAASGGYARFYEVGGTRFSHLIDPRTHWPVEASGGATVVAGDCVTANAISTAASIGGSDTGAALAQAHGATGFLFADGAGRVSGGGLLAAAATGAPEPAPAPANSDAKGANEKSKSASAPAEAGWPAGFKVTVPVILKKIEGPREVYRPYVAIWIENAAGKVVRTLTVWGGDDRWRRKLTMWTYQLGHSGNDYYPTARATRAPGTYLMTWDGTDDYGARLPTGTYKISLEICREAGHHVLGDLKLECEQEPAIAELQETAESDATTVTYGPPKT